MRVNLVWPKRADRTNPHLARAEAKAGREWAAVLVALRARALRCDGEGLASRA